MTQLNPLPSSLAEADFVFAYGEIYEKSPWVAEALLSRVGSGDLDSLDDMKIAMRATVDSASREKQLALLCAHPELAGRVAIAGDMTEASKAEQRAAGLDQCSPDEFAEFMTLNERYVGKFGFPFIIAVKGRDRQSILISFRERIGNDIEAEFRMALQQVHRIAAIRLSAMLAPEVKEGDS